MRYSDQRLDSLLQLATNVDEDELPPADTEARALADEIRRAHPAEHQDGHSVTNRRRMVRLAVVAGVTAVAIAVGGSLIISPDRSPAIAGWEGEPQSWNDALASEATDQCFGTETADATGLDYEPAGDLPLVAMDVRGNAGLVTFADADEYVLCHLVESDQGAWEYWSKMMQTFSGSTQQGGPLVVDVQYRWIHDGQSVTTVLGRVDDEVERVLIELENGARFQATVIDDFVLAWWPVRSDVNEVRALNGDGEVIGREEAPGVGGLITES